MKGRSRPSPSESENYGDANNAPSQRFRRQDDDDYNYEQSQRNLGRTRQKATQDSSQGEQKRGKLIKFCKNNDELFAGVTVSLSNKMFPTYEGLLEYLNTKIPTPSGVRYVFSWPECDEITKITELETGKVYIVSSARKIAKHIAYGAAGAVGKKRAGTEATRQSGQKSRRPTKIKSTSPPSKKQPLILTVISNLARDSVEKMILNPKTNQNFEDMLQDVGTLINIPKEPVTAMYAAEKPYKKIESYSQLFRELDEHDSFLVCGGEEIPIELMSSSSKRESIVDTQSNTRSQHRRKRPRKQNENEPPTHGFQNHQEDEPAPRGRRQKEVGLLKSRQSIESITQQSAQEDGFSTENLEEENMPNYGSANNSEDENYQM